MFCSRDQKNGNVNGGAPSLPQSKEGVHVESTTQNCRVTEKKVRLRQAFCLCYSLGALCGLSTATPHRRQLRQTRVDRVIFQPIKNSYCPSSAVCVQVHHHPCQTKNRTFFYSPNHPPELVPKHQKTKKSKKKKKSTSLLVLLAL